MTGEKLLPRILLISGMVGLLVIGLIFDIIVTALQVQIISGAGYQSLLVMLFPIFSLVLVLGALGLFWYQFSSNERSRPVNILFAVVGLLMVFSGPILFYLPVPDSIYVLIDYLQPYSYFYTAGSLIAGCGVFSLLVKKPASEAG
jgi:hypothetical protein